MVCQSRCPQGPNSRSVEGGAARCCPNLILWFMGGLDYMHCGSSAEEGSFTSWGEGGLAHPQGCKEPSWPRVPGPGPVILKLHSPTASCSWLCPGVGQRGRAGLGKQAPLARGVPFPDPASAGTDKAGLGWLGSVRPGGWGS